MTVLTTWKTLQGWRRGVVGGIATGFLALGLVFGATPAPANADVLDDLAQEFSMGTGAGQVANLLKQTLKLRGQGFRPSQANYQEISEAMDDRPNQKPLIEALSDTLAYQYKVKAQTALISQGQNANSAVMGAGQMPSDGRMGQGGYPANGQPNPNAAPPAPAPAPAP